MLALGMVSDLCKALERLSWATSGGPHLLYKVNGTRPITRMHAMYDVLESLWWGYSCASSTRGGM